MAMRGPPAIEAGSIAAQEQPVLAAGVDVEMRPWRAADVPFALEAFTDAGIQRWHLRSMDSVAEAEAWIAGHAVAWQAETSATWAIARPDGGGGAVLGRISLYVKDLRSGAGEVSYWVLPGSRGAGLAGRAAATVATWAIDEVGFHRIELMHSTQNPASCRVAERAGFTAEGVLQEALLHADGWHDMHLHRRLAAP